MPLLDLQAAMVRLYTDSAYRERFFADPQAACQSLPLSPDERKQLVALSRSQVERYALTLKNKRLGGARELLPVTSRVLGPRFMERFFDYCDRVAPADNPVHDAVRFAAELAQELSPRQALARDVAVCERFRLEILNLPATQNATASGPITASSRPKLSARARVVRFQFDLERVYPALATGDPADPEPDRSYILIGKAAKLPLVNLKRINEPTARVLLMCDSSRTLAEILEESAVVLSVPRHERAAFAEQAIRLINLLVQDGLIETG